MNTTAVEMFRQHGLSYEDAIVNPSRRVVRGLLVNQTDMELPRGEVYVDFEPDAVLVIPGDFSASEVLIPYAEVVRVDFLPAPGYLKLAKGRHLGLTLVDFTWTSGWFALVSPFGSPEEFGRRYAVAMERIDPAGPSAR